MPRKKGPATPEADVVPLSRWRASLARARTTSRMRTLLELPDAAKVVPQLPVQDVYYAIQEVGLREALDLLEIASPTQIRGFLDLDAWSKDRLDETRSRSWIDALLTLGPEKLGSTFAALDAELASLFLARHAKVYDLSLGERPPEDSDYPLFPTPDRFFMLELTGDAEAVRTAERLLDFLYRADKDLARRVVMGARWELPSELEETSYRWRSGRMADLGFVDYYEALELYRFLDPRKVSIGEGTATLASAEAEAPISMPAPYLAPLEQDLFFQRAARELGTEEEVRALQRALVTLANRVMAADQVDPTRIDEVGRSLERALGFLSIGLEYLSQGEIGAAVQALATISLTRIFRVGVSLTLQLGSLAKTLRQRYPDRFEPEWSAFLAALEQRPPTLRLPGEAKQRPFQTVAEIREAAQRIEQASAQADLVMERLGFRAATGTFGDLFRTAAANLALGRSFVPTPLSATDLAALREAVIDKDALAPAFRAAVSDALRETADEQTHRPLAQAWLDRLETELASVEKSPDPRFVGGLLYAS